MASTVRHIITVVSALVLVLTSLLVVVPERSITYASQVRPAATSATPDCSTVNGNLVQDCGMESVPAGSDANDGAAVQPAGWTGAGSFGTASTTSSFTPPTPYGQRSEYLQSEATLWQQITVPTDGRLTLSYAYALTCDSTEPDNNWLESEFGTDLTTLKVFGRHEASGCGVWRRATVTVNNVTAGTYYVQFLGGGASGDTAFVDDVVLSEQSALGSGPGGTDYGYNLILNGDAEGSTGSTDGSVVDTPYWGLAYGTPTAVQYGSPGFPSATDPGPSNRGSNFFAGGSLYGQRWSNGQSSFLQIVPFSPSDYNAIDAGQVTYTSSGFLGGSGSDLYQAHVELKFMTAAFRVVALYSNGCSLNAPTSGRNGAAMLFAESCSGTVPATARLVQVTVRFYADFNAAQNSYITSYADNLSLQLSGPTPTLNPTQTQLQPTTNPTQYGQSPAFTATVTGSDTPSGLVEFTDGSTAIPGCGAVQLMNGAATCNTTGLAIGDHQISAMYAGSGTDAGSTSPTIKQTVTQETPTIVLVSDTPTAPFGQTVVFTANMGASYTGAPSGTVSFQSGGVDLPGCGSVAINGGQAHCSDSTLPVGTTYVTAVYSGDSIFTSLSSQPFAQTINQPTSNPTTTQLSSGTNPSQYGQNVSLTATVTGSDTPTGNVEFMDGRADIPGCSAVPLSSGSATCNSTGLTISDHQITAVYGGGGTDGTSTSAPLDQTVNKETPTISVASDQSSPVFGQTVTFTATASAPYTGTPTGTIEFQSGGKDIANCGAVQLVNGQASCLDSALPVGTTYVRAIYQGDSTFGFNVSPVFGQTVNQATPQVTLKSDQIAPVFGQQVTLTATLLPPDGGTPTGTVEFQADGSDIVNCSAISLTGLTAQCLTSSLSIASHDITAIYSGDGSFTSSTSNDLSQPVGQETPTIGLQSNTPSAQYGQTVTLTAALTAPYTGTPTGTIEFQSDGVDIATCGGVQLSSGSAQCITSGLAVGQHSITAIYSGDSTFLAGTPGTTTQSVAQATPLVQVKSDTNSPVYGQKVTFTAALAAPYAGTPGGNVEFQADGVDIPQCGSVMIVAGTATCATTALSAGGHQITAIYAGSTNFARVSSSGLQQSVAQAATSIGLSSSVDTTNPIGIGTPITFTATVAVQAPGAGAPTGSVRFTDPVALTDLNNCTAQPVDTTLKAICSISTLGVGAHTIEAVYSGDPNFMGNTSSTITLHITQATSHTLRVALALTAPYTNGVKAQITNNGIPLGSATPSMPLSVQVSGPLSLGADSVLLATTGSNTQFFTGFAPPLIGPLTADTGTSATYTTMEFVLQTNANSISASADRTLSILWALAESTFRSSYASPVTRQAAVRTFYCTTVHLGGSIKSGLANTIKADATNAFHAVGGSGTPTC